MHKLFNDARILPDVGIYNHILIGRRYEYSNRMAFTYAVYPFFFYITMLKLWDYLKIITQEHVEELPTELMMGQYIHT